MAFAFDGGVEEEAFARLALKRSFAQFRAFWRSLAHFGVLPIIKRPSFIIIA